MITNTTAQQVRDCAGSSCEGCGKRLDQYTPSLSTKGDLHHINYKSQYFGDDRDEARNLALLCVNCHTGNEGVHNGNKDLDLRLKAEALKRKPIEKRSTGKVVQVKTSKSTAQKDRERIQRKTAREKRLERFKERNNGLTPSQVAYRRKKKYLYIQKQKKRDEVE